MCKKLLGETVSVASLQKTCEAIEDTFEKHVTAGYQTLALDNSEIAACGQFISLPPDARITQRGLHGTSSALLVLWGRYRRRADSDSRTSVRRLLEYLRRREDVEDIDKVVPDPQNVIKSSELLLALATLSQNGIQFDDIAEVHIKNVRSGYLDKEKRWPFIANGDGESHDLPTAYAVAALSRWGRLDNADEIVSDLIRRLESKHGSGAPTDTRMHVDIAVDIFVLYCLTFLVRNDDVLPEHRNRMGRIFKRISNRVTGIFPYGLEQNVEYYNENKTFYVRIPWDMYIIALSAKYDYFFGYCSIRIQSRLREIIELVGTGDGFFYQHSGRYRSSRTYSILYQVLKYIEGEVQGSRFTPLATAIDQVRGFLGGMIVRVSLGLLLVAFGGYFVYVYFKHPNAPVANLANELIGGTLLLILQQVSMWISRRS